MPVIIFLIFLSALCYCLFTFFFNRILCLIVNFGSLKQSNRSQISPSSPLSSLPALANSHSIEKRQAGLLRITPAGNLTVASGKNSFFTCKADVPNPELVRDLTWFAPDGRRIPEDDRYEDVEIVDVFAFPICVQI